MTNHPSIEDIELLLQEALDPGKAEEVRSHLDSCAACREQYEQCEANDQVLPHIREAAELLNSELPPGDARFEKWAYGLVNLPPRDLFPGYEIVSEIHRGGQGIVYQAIQKSTPRKVAIKVMKEGLSADPRDRARFEREIQILAALKHPGIVKIIDRGNTEAGVAFMVMDYVEGEGLDKFVASFRREHLVGHGDLGDLLRLFVKIADAVNAAHTKGVVHRDLKPSNIRIDEQGEPHILDFGLARTPFMAMTDESHPQPVSITGHFVGSLCWASPEQVGGIPGQVNASSDVYSLGVILYQMLTGGSFPYQVTGPMKDVLTNILTTPPTPPSQVLSATDARNVKSRRRRRHPAINEVIEAIVLKSLAKSPKKRYRSAGEFAEDVANYLAGRPTIAAGDRLFGWPRRTAVGALIAAGVGLCAVMSVLLTLYITRSEHQRPNPSSPPSRTEASASSAGQNVRPGSEPDVPARPQNQASGPFAGETQTDAEAAATTKPAPPPQSPGKTPSPSPRYLSAMSYDAGREVTTLFGGASDDGPNNETWEWDGMAWIQRAAKGIAPRFSHAMTYDASRGVTVLFGGHVYDDGFIVSGETCLWDGTSWRLKSVSGPEGRCNHAMVYDNARSVTVLFGGQKLVTTPFQNDTWEWDGSRWQQRDATGPKARCLHAMAYDSARRVTVSFGGQTGIGEYDGETWEWDGQTWSRKAITGPSPRSGHAMEYDSGRQVTVLFGGTDGTPSGETWEWDGARWTRKATTGPTPRQHVRMSYQAHRKVTVLFGGHVGDGCSGETWEWNGSMWTQR